MAPPPTQASKAAERSGPVSRGAALVVLTAVLFVLAAWVAGRPELLGSIVAPAAPAAPAAELHVATANSNGHGDGHGDGDGATAVNAEVADHHNDDTPSSGCGCGGHALQRNAPTVPAGRTNPDASADADTDEHTKPSEPAAPPAASASVSAEASVETSWRDRNAVRIPAGRFHMGTDQPGNRGDFEDDGRTFVATPPTITEPARWVTIAEPYYMDRTEVTNAQFREFMESTRHKTDAEKYGWSFVFEPQVSAAINAKVTQVVQQAPHWLKVDDSRWDRPAGPDSDVSGLDNHPVVHVSFNDAQAYCRWRGGYVPTEAQWERAARGGVEDEVHPWGNELEAGGQHHCNVYQGRFPVENTAADGFMFTAPVQSFAPNRYGLYDVIGNVWEWTSSPFRPDGRTPNLVCKGGSFLCHASYCNRYRSAARMGNEPDSSTSNMGFRCAYDADPERDPAPAAA